MFIGLTFRTFETFAKEVDLFRKPSPFSVFICDDHCFKIFLKDMCMYSANRNAPTQRIAQPTSAGQDENN